MKFSITLERGERIYTLYVSQSSPRRAYIYAHIGIHSLPDADMANKLSRKPLLIRTHVGNVSNRSEAPPTDRENLSAYFLWYCFYTGSLGKLSSTRNAVSSARKAYYRLEASIQYLSTPVTHQLEGRHRRLKYRKSMKVSARV